MRRIIILTTNLLADKKLQEILQRSNYEVLCSTSIFQSKKFDFTFLENFSLIIFSDAISDFEINKCNHQLTDLAIPMVRIGEKISMNSTTGMKSSTDAKPLVDFAERIELDTSYQVVLEKIAQLIDEEESRLKNKPDLSVYPMMIASLSKNEYKFLYYLFLAENTMTGAVVDRKKLCHLMWEDEGSNSALSRLSVIFKKTKLKLSSLGLCSDDIYCIWGKGYQLGEELFQFLSENSFGESKKILGGVKIKL